MIATLSPKHLTAKSKNKIDPRLIYEIFDGKPIYFQGYKNVINGIKSKEEIMGSSGLQIMIIQYFLMHVLRSLDLKKYWIFTNEVGIHIDKKNNIAGDLVIFEKEKLPIAVIDKQYISRPPKIHIEVDIDADIENFETVDNYIFKKTDKLLKFGVEKVIWVLTASKKVIIATELKNWEIIDWNKNIEIMDNVNFNIGQYLQEEGSTFA